MFQTDPILWLQSFDTRLVVDLFRSVSFLGETSGYAILLIILLAGFDFRKGIVAANALLWTAVLTYWLKDFFSLPRPSDVDNAVRLLGTDQPNDSPFAGRDAAGFWSGLPGEVITHFRAHPPASYGFPSGHCSSTVATWGALALVYRKTWVLLVAMGLGCLMPLTRMFLGKHFLADVLAGALLGLVVLLVLYALMIRSNALVKGILHPVPSAAPGRHPFRMMLMLVLLPLAALVLSSGPAERQAGTLLGLNCAFLFAAPAYDRAAHTWPARIARVLVAGAIFLSMSPVLAFLVNIIPGEGALTYTGIMTAATAFCVAAFPPFVVRWLLPGFRRPPISRS